jgi:pyruvate,water dikinase
VDAFATFLARYGHRGTREIELGSPRWREDPTPLLAMLRNVLDGADERASSGSVVARREAAEEALDRHMRGRMSRWVARRLARRISYYAALRENTRHWHSLAFAAVRSKVQAIEQQLIADGRLKCTDDIWFLHWDEILDLEAGRAAWRHVEDRVRRRRLRHLRRGRQAPLTYNLALDEVTQGSLRLDGSCASPGRAEGRARLVTDPAIDGRLEPGEVLVAPFTDPTWTPLFLNASAIVVETGSYLSHAGTIARELGIPCLVDVRGVMDRVSNGQRLSIDATAGHVLLLESATEGAAT